ncbi:hypothetical protein [Pseudalkalibacillus sp. NRS-1564]|uniref:hypothetical protein n=1 Tax=Pseudalkalibacillus sp. NRS-1564 TaxID=3233900 RepID=UPI003D26A265
MVAVLLSLAALFLGLALFMIVVWNAIKTDSSKSDLEMFWKKYEEIIRKEDVL